MQHCPGICIPCLAAFQGKSLGFFTGAMFLASRMAYYQIGQVLGLMETMALWMAISILWNLYRYVNEENREKCFYIASLLYFGVCFVHERYMTLLPLLLLALLLKQCKKYPSGSVQLSLLDWYS